MRRRMAVRRSWKDECGVIEGTTEATAMHQSTPKLPGGASPSHRDVVKVSLGLAMGLTSILVDRPK
jgi:hypothetical protein